MCMDNKCKERCDGIPGGYPWSSKALDEFGDLIRRDIIGDLNHFMVPLIEVKDNHVYLVHSTFRVFLLETFDQTTPKEDTPRGELAQDECTSGDQHYAILVRCLEYMEIFAKHSSAPTIYKDGIQCCLPAEWKLSLLGYASFHWPQHFQKTASKSIAHTFTMQFLQDGERVESWINLCRRSKQSPRCNNIRLNSPLKIVCKFGLIELVDDCIDLVKPMEDFHDQMRESLDLAAQNGHENVIQILLKKGIRSPEALGLAAAEGFEDIVESLLAANSDINKLGQTSYAPLHHATCGGHKHIVSLLLERGADPNVVTSRLKQSNSEPNSDMDESELSLSEKETIDLSHPIWSETSLHLAALTGQIEIAEILLVKGASVDVENSSGYDVLKYAAAGGFSEMLTLLLKHNADTKKQSKSVGNTALHVAVAHGNYKAAKILLQSISDASQLIHTVNMSGVSPIHVAAREGHLSLVGLMLDAENVESSNRKNQHQLIGPHRRYLSQYPGRVSRWSTIEVSPERKSDPAPLTMSSNHRKSALEWAAKHGHYHVVRYLLGRNNGSKQEDNSFALISAAQNGHTRIVEALLNDNSTKAATDSYQNTALHLAAEGGHLETLSKLLEHSRGAALFRTDAVTKKGMTPLHIAAENGHFEVVKRLCAFKNIIWMKVESSYTAFDLVVNRNNVKEVKKFIQILEEITHDGKEFVRGGLPLHNVCRYRNTEILSLLLDKGWKCDTKDTNGATPLHKAVMKNFLQGVEVLLHDPTCDINALDVDGTTAIHHARSPEMVESLLEAGAKNDLKDVTGRTPLYCAAFYRRLEVARALLDSTPKPDVHTKEEGGWTLLHATYDSAPLTSLILSKDRVDLNSQSNDGRTPLAMSIRWNYRRNAEVLLEKGANPSCAEDFETSPLYMALIREESLSLIKLLVSHDVDLLAKDSCCNKALHIAARKGKHADVEYLFEKLGHIEKTKITETCASVLCECVLAPNFNPETAKLLVDQSQDVNRVVDSRHFTALHAACSKGSILAVKWLLEKEADVSVTGGKYGSALCAAVESEKDAEEKVSLLLETGCDINFVEENKPTALQRAAARSNVKLINLLLSKGANVNLTGGDLDTPLNAAIQGGIDLTTINTMLAHNADIKNAGIRGKLPIHAAAAGDRVDVLQALIHAGADLLAKDIDGRSALMHGVASESIDIINYLLDHQSFDANEADATLQTPLIVAAMLDNRVIVNRLLENGISKPETLNTQDYEGKTALFYAVLLDHFETVKKLLDMGANPCIVDYRNRSPLYWAARAARSESILDIIIEALMKHDNTDDAIKFWNIAIHGAVASNRWVALKKLLSRENVDVEYAGPDGWSPLYTARSYKYSYIEEILRNGSHYPLSATTPLKRPSRWHSNDRSPRLKLESNGTTLSTVGEMPLITSFEMK